MDSERFPLFRGRKSSFRGIPSSAEEPIPRLGTERNSEKNEVLRKSHGLYDHSDNLYILHLSVPQKSSFLLWNGSERNSEFASIFVLRNGISSCFLFRWRVRKGILSVCFYFCSTERNSEFFSLPLKCSEGNSDNLLLFLLNGMEFRVIFSSTEGFGTKFREFSVPRNSRNSVGNNHLFRLFRLPRNKFFVGNFQPY